MAGSSFGSRARIGYAAIVLAGVFAFIVASASGSSYTNTNTITIVDGTPSSPYPSTITVAGMVGTTTAITVSFNNLTHGKPQDIDMVLIGPTGSNATIMSDVGGSTSVSGLNLTLDDTAGSAMTTAALVSGTFQPTNLGASLDVWPAPAPPLPSFPTTPAVLNVFIGGNPNGLWKLFVVDDGTTQPGSIGSWSLNVTTSGTPLTVFPGGAITINDRIVSPLPATPYPSPITVAGLAGTVADVNVRLKTLQHTFPDDIDVMLEGPGGQNAIVMSDVGGANDAQSVTLTLDDSAVNPLPDSTQLTTGSFQPTNIGAGDPFPAPAPAPSGLTALSTFNGTNPNGTWNLWVVDDLEDDAGYFLDGWQLDLAGPTAAGVTHLTASTGRAGTVIRWTTGTETGVAGFNLYRGRTKLNAALIPARHAGQARGAAYQFVDRKAPGSATYRLEVVRLDGTRTAAGWASVNSSQ
jgi:subtilisin-like proprotein convertase family protein